MANLYKAKEYAYARPTYPDQLFEFIASKTPSRDLAWDVGTGTGQAIPPEVSIDLFQLARMYKKVIGTDTSPDQIDLTPKLQNATYFVTPPTMSIQELQKSTSISESTVDLITVAEALHWFDLPNFYAQVKWALKKPNGLFAAWCYPPMPDVDDKVNAVFGPFFEGFDPFWNDRKHLLERVMDKYKSIDFPFRPADGLDHTGPFDFVAVKGMTLEDYFTLIRSWSAYKTAKDKGVELLTEAVVDKFRTAWESGGNGDQKLVKFHISLRIGLGHVRLG